MENYSQSPENYLNFHGKDWNVLRSYLREQQELTMLKLCENVSHDETLILRGKLRAIRDILALEQAAPKAASQE
jgi:hypothetical protein